MSIVLPDRNEHYLHSAYWNTRFEGEQQYDWFKGFNEFKHLCIGHLRCTDSICILGCGNSTLTQDLYNSGYHNLTSVDLSDVVIDRMREKAAAASQDAIKWQVGTQITNIKRINARCPFLAGTHLHLLLPMTSLDRLLLQGMLGAASLHEWHVLQVADMLDLPYSDSTFDVVIEKGTMDVLFVDNDDPFNPKAQVRQRVFQMLNETHR